jgi:SAM-dependent methyltransferase
MKHILPMNRRPAPVCRPRSMPIDVSVPDASIGRCILCGSSSDPVVVREADYVGRSCGCGIVYIDPCPDADRVEPTGDEHADEYYELPAKIRLDWVAQIEPRGRLLEVGCGWGHFVAGAKRRGYQVAAIEPNPARARHVREVLGIDVEQASIETASPPAVGFDIVYHIDLLSHFPEPTRALRAMVSQLRPGGRLCFEVGIFGGLAAGWYKWVGRPGFPQHRWFYSEAALREILRRADLRVEKIKRFAILPATIVSSLGLALLGQPLGNQSPQASSRPARAKGLRRGYAWLQYVLRYRLGAYLPPIGPQVFFVCAVPDSARPSSACDPGPL